MRLTYAIIGVRDMARSVAFYRDALGLPLRFESPEWTEFATEGGTVALHPGKDAGSPAPTTSIFAGTCRPGLGVPDLDAFHARMLGQGVRCLREPESVHGARVAQYADPDGLPISVGELRKGQ